MDPPPRPSSTDPSIPKQVDQVIATGMAKDPGNRYATTIELANAARDALTTPIPQVVKPPTRPGTDVVREASADTVEERGASQPADTVLDHPDTPPPQPLVGPTLDATMLANPPPIRGKQAPGFQPGLPLFQRMSQRVRIAAGAAVLAVIAAVVATISVSESDTSQRLLHRLRSSCRSPASRPPRVWRWMPLATSISPTCTTGGC